MGAKLNFLGQKFVMPKGIRKSPGTNAYASCVAKELEGKHGKVDFRGAAAKCKGTRG